MMPDPQTMPRDAPAQQQGARGTSIPGQKPPTEVTGPDGKKYTFPADASDAEIMAFFEGTKPKAPATSNASRTWGDAITDFGSGVLSQVNPVTLLTSLYQGVVHPIDTAGAIVGGQIDQFKQGKKAFDEGRYSEAYGHTMAGIIPLLGPQAVKIGQAIGSGDPATAWHGLGEGVGLIGAIEAPRVASGIVKGASRLTEATGTTERIAGVAGDMAQRRMVNVMAPKVGANKTRFGNMAADVANDIASEPGLTARSRLVLQRKIGDKLTSATDALDVAADARNAGNAFDTAPILADLRKARAKLTAEAVKGSHVEPAMTGASPSGLVKMPEAVPLGRDVVPGPNQTRVAQIDQAIKEIEALGPMARYDSLKLIRQAYDQVAKVKYSPSMTADFLAKNAEASGAADVTGVIREHLASIDPATAAANKTYSLFKKAEDVMDATEEIERTRPTVGRKIAARLTGAVAGEAAGGTTGAAIGVLIGPVVDELLSSGPTMKVSSARALQTLADALRSGNAETISAAVARARGIAVAARASYQPDKDK